MPYDGEDDTEDQRAVDATTPPASAVEAPPATEAPPAPAAAAAAAPAAVDTEAPPTTPDGQPLPSLPTPNTATPEPRKKRGAEDEDMFEMLGHALHGGITSLKNVFGLNDQDAAVRDPARYQHGQQALRDGYGAANPEEYDEAAKAVDPEGRLTEAERMIQVMNKGYEHFMQAGDVTKANNYAAMIIQYSTHEASVYAATAMRDLRKGDMQGAADNATKASEHNPWGGTTHAVEPKPGGGFKSDETDVKTGKIVATHDVTGEQLFNLAMGVANKSTIWQGIMDAAASRPGQTKTYNAADNAQIARARAGLEPDGGAVDVTSGGKPGEATGAPTPLTGRGAMPDLRPENQEQLTSMMPTYQKMLLGGESYGGKDLPSTTGHDAAGRYQIQSKTWENITKQSPYVKGPDGKLHDERLDPVKSQKVFEQITQKDAAMFQQQMGRMPSLGELAMMHQQGAGGGIALVKAMEKNPAALASSVVPFRNLSGNGMADPKITVADAVSHIQNYYLKYAGPGAAGAAQPVRVAQNTAPGAPMTDAGPAPVGASAAPGAPEAVPTALPRIPLASASNAPPPPTGTPNPFAVHAPLPADQGPALPTRAPFTPASPRQYSVTPGMSAMGKSAIDQINIAWRAKANADNAASKANADKMYADGMKAYGDQIKQIRENIGKPATQEDRDKADTLVKDLVQQGSPLTMAKFNQLAPSTQDTIKSAMFGIAVRNHEFPPNRIFDFAMSMATPPEKGYRPGFTVHATPNENYMRVRFREGEEILMPKGILNELSGVMGNENYLRRIGVEKKEQGEAQSARDMALREAARGPAERAALRLSDRFNPEPDASLRALN